MYSLAPKNQSAHCGNRAIQSRTLQATELYRAVQFRHRAIQSLTLRSRAFSRGFLMKGDCRYYNPNQHRQNISLSKGRLPGTKAGGSSIN